MVSFLPLIESIKQARLLTSSVKQTRLVISSIRQEGLHISSLEIQAFLFRVSHKQA
jgi:hypothetical protein